MCTYALLNSDHLYKYFKNNSSMCRTPPKTSYNQFVKLTSSLPTPGSLRAVEFKIQNPKSRRPPPARVPKRSLLLLSSSRLLIPCN
ncbi:hypothetical protein M5K25_004993 [Dendrobium thyrsiflorum]|uniref:Uncharacterized protein n=1 Tax=Dendrobium thyrsiflorum TaxID=117978 RepID=A0ABD0VH15_DENTH